ncbi:MAG: hypothetical protein AAF585_20840, partial [Verrucomicrobiota bacterium]
MGGQLTNIKLGQNPATGKDVALSMKLTLDSPMEPKAAFTSAKERKELRQAMTKALEKALE